MVIIIVRILKYPPERILDTIGQTLCFFQENRSVEHQEYTWVNFNAYQNACSGVNTTYIEQLYCTML